MIVVIDTSVWSLVLRRRAGASLQADETSHVRNLNDLILAGRVALLGAIRQELLSGIKERKQFARLQHYLAAFPDVPLLSSHYERAAEMWNTCRSHGIVGSPTDMLICSVASGRDWLIYTLDQDFSRYAKYLPLKFL
jgi:hypothetical protein